MCWDILSNYHSFVRNIELLILDPELLRLFITCSSLCSSDFALSVVFFTTSDFSTSLLNRFWLCFYVKIYIHTSNSLFICNSSTSFIRWFRLAIARFVFYSALFLDCKSDYLRFMSNALCLLCYFYCYLVWWILMRLALVVSFMGSAYCRC